MNTAHGSYTAWSDCIQIGSAHGWLHLAEWNYIERNIMLIEGNTTDNILTLTKCRQRPTEHYSKDWRFSKFIDMSMLKSS